MSDQDKRKTDDAGEMEDFEAMLAGFDQPGESFERGDEVTGRIHRIGKEFAFIALGGKSEGVLPLEDIQNDAGEVVYEVGQEITATVMDPASRDGGIRLARRIRGPEDDAELRQAFESGVAIQGTVAGRNKGGYDIKLGSRQAFCPISQIEAAFTEDPDVHLGQSYSFLVTELDQRRIVVSRARLQQREQEEAKARLREVLREGDVVDGTVKQLRDFGAFVDIGGVDGLVHLSELSWARVESAAEAVKVGDKVKVKILALDWAKNRISLSLKQAQDDPWKGVLDRYQTGQRCRGTVVRIADFGAFVELEPGIDGLVHISDLTWTRRVRTPGDVVSVGDSVEVQILDVDAMRKRISLGVKQVGGDPWDGVEERLAPGTRVVGRTEKIASFGVFIELEPGVTALLPASESAVPRGQRLDRNFPLGGEIEVEVLELHAADRRISVTRKPFADADSEGGYAGPSEDRPQSRQEGQPPRRREGGPRRDSDRDRTGSHIESTGGFGTFGDLLRGKLGGAESDKGKK
jgi:small subunit ribosomal protein S1